MNNNDLIVGFDPTGSTSITGAQLAQLVNSATPSSDRGLILITTDDNSGNPNVPDARNTGTPAFARYMWLRVSSNYVTAYVWNPSANSDVTILKWVTISQAAIAPSSIQGYQIAPSTITADKIATVNSSSIQGGIVQSWLAALNVGNTAVVSDGVLSSSLFTNANLVWGDLQGSGATPGTPVIKPLAVTQTKLARQAVAGSLVLNSVTPANSGQIVDNSITSIQLLSANPTHGLKDATNISHTNTNIPAIALNAVDPFCNISVPQFSGKGAVYTPATILSTASGVAAGDILVVNTALDGYVTVSRAVLNLAEPVAPTDGNKILQVNTGGTAYVLNVGSGANKIGEVLKRKYILSTSETGIADVTGSTYSTMAINATAKITAFQPISATSKIVIRVTGIVITNSVGDNCHSALFVDTSGLGTFAGSYANSVVSFSDSGCYTNGTTPRPHWEMVYQISNQATTFDVALGYASGSANGTIGMSAVQIEVIEYAN